MHRWLLALCLAAGVSGCADEPSAARDVTPRANPAGDRSAISSVPEAPAAPATPANYAPPADAIQLSPITLAIGALAATLEAPAGALASTRFGVTHVNASSNSPDRRFAIAIEPARGPLNERRAVIDENPLNRLVRYHLAEPDALLYESGRDGRPEHHVLVHIVTSAGRFECSDRKGPDYSLLEADAMLRACRSLVTRAGQPQPAPGGSP